MHQSNEVCVIKVTLNLKRNTKSASYCYAISKWKDIQEDQGRAVTEVFQSGNRFTVSMVLRDRRETANTVSYQSCQVRQVTVLHGHYPVV